jgi:cytidylate kinase
MEFSMIITIDGPVATGKSTVAKRLAEQLGYIYFDTGAMYRAVAYGIMKAGIDVDDPVALAKFLDQFQYSIHVRRGVKHYFFGDEDITTAIRSPAVTSIVSKISAQQIVRDKLVALQRSLAEGVNAVFEGRDMGTVVFPKADLKIFLTGSPEVRAQRRLEELQRERPVDAKDLSLEQMTQEIEERDRYDSTRANSPLRKADDAFEVDTSKRTVDEVVFQILEYKDKAKMRRVLK